MTQGFTVEKAASLYLGMVLLVLRALRIKASFDYAQRFSAEAVLHSNCCPTLDMFCFKPGYHTNNQKDSAEIRQEHFYGILCGIARSILSDRRPRWKHPRWHIWHWRIQVPLIQSIKRAFFDRCCKCGKGFRWGESVIGDWNGTRIWHDRCDDSSKTVKPPETITHPNS
jgi:hypothetical protein